ncbi:hypothetical protein MBLNU459_g5752t1 [Dothideomycetes sp. NU459]
MSSPIQDFSESRRATPTIPPGFSAPPGLSKEVGSPTPSRPSSRASLRRGNSAITPAVPVLPATPLRTSTPLRQETKLKVAATDDIATPTKPGKEVKAEAVKAARATEVKHGRSDKVQSPETSDGPVAKQANQSEGKNVPVATHSKARLSEVEEQRKDDYSAPQPAPLSAAQLLQQKHHAKANQETFLSKAPETSKHDAGKHKRPGKLDITAAVTKGAELPTSSVVSTPLKTETPGKLSRAGSTGPISRPVSPTASTDSPLRKTAPRTLRVVATPGPKIETSLPAGNAAPSLPNIATRFPSRQPSIASMNPPGTPSSEHISDNISVTSTSFSRASSPPLGKSIVGSAPARSKTKNQQKKDRQERAKQIEEEKRLAEENLNSNKDEPVQEAITSRKKKTKKSAASGATSSTPATSRPPSPKAKKVEEQAAQPPPKPSPGLLKAGSGKEIKSAAPATAPVPAPTTTSISAPNQAPNLASASASVPAPATAPATAPAPAPAPASSSARPASPSSTTAPVPASASSPAPSPQPPNPPAVTPASVIADLRSASGLISSAIDNLFRPIAQSNTHYKATQPVTAHDLNVPRSLQKNPEIKIHPNQLYSMLSNHHGLHYGGEDERIWSRGVITPGGAHLRHLEEALENRFIELEKELRLRPTDLKFHPLPNPKLPPGGLDAQFPQFDLIAYKRELEIMEGRKRDPNAMEKAVEEGSKKGSFLVDTAGKYVNEFVMPPVPVIQPPPPAAGSAFSRPAAKAAAAAVDSGAVALGATKEGGPVMTVEEAERSLVESRKVAEEREAQLRRLVKRNRKLVGMTH